MRKVSLVAALLALVSLLGACSVFTDDPSPQPPRPTPSAETQRPNIVLITSDDQTAMEMEWMPRTRELLGEHGVTFSNMIAPHPNCCPARAQILTGQYAHNNGVATNSPPNGGFEGFTAQTALPVWLQGAGYRTGFIGKYLHGYDGSTGVEPGWDSFRPMVTQPLSRYYGPLQFDHGQLREWPRTAYHTDLVAEQSREFIDDPDDSDKPFFLWASYIAPHGSCETSEEITCAGPPPAPPGDETGPDTSDVRLPSLDSPSFNEADLGDKPPRLRNTDEVDAEAQQRLFSARLRSLAALDDAVADTIQALDEAGELDNTVVAFTSDNGYMFGEHRQTGKVLAYEESVRVPLLLRGPGVPEGPERRQTVAMIDLAPTFAELTEADPQVTVDGQSLWGYATRNVGQGDRALLIQGGSSNPDPDRLWQFRAVRTERYTYIDWRGRAFELYDRATDPNQLQSLHRNKSYAKVRTRLADLLEDLGECEGKACQVEQGR